MKLLAGFICLTLIYQVAIATPIVREITDDDISLPDFITPEMVICMVQVLEESHHYHPEIAWWFADAIQTLHNLVVAYNGCNDLITNVAQTACRASVTAQAAVQLNRLRNTINDNMENGAIWFDNLRTNWQECLVQE